MKRAIVSAAVLLAAFFIHPQVPDQSVELNKQQMFGLELQACNQAFAEGKPSKCELYGKIKVVDNFPDVKIERVDNFADIKVKWVDNFADEPGKWEKVDNFADYKVEFVDNFGDYKVEFVDNFPGCK